jgi:glycogen debranching enzyme GlgX
VLEHISSLGITAVKLLPVHTFVDDSYLLDKGLKNYWGYNTISFFSPERRSAGVPDFAFSEFKEMVARFHSADIEVILDVVYNHSAEGNELGPTLCFKGIDNASYYRLMPDQRRYYINDTGTGNTVNLSHQRVLQMVTDSLRYWAQEMHVDGFRFDLGSILARALRIRRGRRLSGFLPLGSGTLVHQADRQAVGLRPWRLPGRRIPTRLGRVERPLSRRGPVLLEGREGALLRPIAEWSRPEQRHQAAGA